MFQNKLRQLQRLRKLRFALLIALCPPLPNCYLAQLKRLHYGTFSFPLSMLSFFSSVSFFERPTFFSKGLLLLFSRLLIDGLLTYYFSKIHLKVFLIIFQTCPANED